MMPVKPKQIESFNDLIGALPKSDKKVWAMVTTPGDSVFLQLEGQRFIGPDGAGFNLAAAYEAVVFSSDWQVNAVRNGEAAHLTIIEKADDDEFEIEQEYFLWGSAVAEGSAGGWATLADPRIGEIQVPATEDIQKGARMKLVAQELVCTDEKTGNAYVAAQRYTGFKVVSEEASK